MKEIKEYSVITNGDISRLIGNVQELIANGWQPYGNLVITSLESKPGSENSKILTTYHQPMVKYM